ncbi:hypothetical protein LYNGBM3L_28540 [Moorena producens 3L]|uniref:Uncharacterized protein n=1 Tax=Moorena producens 3L TaxID=489825 RepID=F4XPB1_9CYAN|nr:hypothetical protein LYNGBM3L_28540 [Moorena producens 3L]
MISYQLSAISSQLSALSYQLSVISLTQQWWVTGSNLTLATRRNMKAPLKHH